MSPRIVCVACGNPTDSLLSPLCIACATGAPAKGTDQHVGQMIAARAAMSNVVVSQAMTTDTRDALLEKPSYILAMNVLQSGMYRTNMDARDAVDAILAEHAAATDAIRTPLPEDARDGAMAELACAAKAMVDPPLRYVGATIEIDCGDRAAAMQVVARVRAALAALTQPEATR